MKILLISLSLLISSCSTFSKDVVKSEVIVKTEVPEKIKEIKVEVETLDINYVDGVVIMLLLMLFIISIARYIKEK